MLLNDGDDAVSWKSRVHQYTHDLFTLIQIVDNSIMLTHLLIATYAEPKSWENGTVYFSSLDDCRAVSIAIVITIFLFAPIGGFPR